MPAHVVHGALVVAAAFVIGLCLAAMGVGLVVVAVARLLIGWL